MEKVLRSFIHENFPKELRVELDLLSRNRSYNHSEKQTEIINIMAREGIDITQLGPGTNRYAFKLKGFVVKIAMDHDGKIDNLKEFKMAKRLYPYVAATHEVSENGVILIAEYIQPFQGYSDMLTYADEIRAILRELSKHYLIGDVGITSVNYSNWGLRIGQDKPVCLDFAYVYSVNSNLFLCHECKTNSILIPDKDFVYLKCSNPSCKSSPKKFEDIRARLGNDIHAHEIGDLSEEGYTMETPFKRITLDSNRSNYLNKKKYQKQMKVKQEKEQDEDPVTPNIFKEETVVKELVQASDLTSVRVLNQEESFGGIILKGTVVPDEEADIVIDGRDGTVINNVIGGKNVSSPSPSVFEFSEETSEEEKTVEEEEEGQGGVFTFDPNATTEPLKFQHVEVLPEGVTVTREESSLVAQKVIPTRDENVSIIVEETIPATKTNITRRDEPKFTSKLESDVDTTSLDPSKSEWKPFEVATGHVFSQFANKACAILKVAKLYEMVYVSTPKTGDVKGKFYRAIGNAIYRSLIEYCQFVPNTTPGPDGKCRPRFFPPEDLFAPQYMKVMTFMKRYWNAHEYNDCALDQVMDSYRMQYPDIPGLPVKWLELFIHRLHQKHEGIDLAEIDYTIIKDTISGIFVDESVVDEEVVEEKEEDSEADETAAIEQAAAAHLVEETVKHGGKQYGFETSEEEEDGEVKEEETGETSLVSEVAKEIAASGGDSDFDKLVQAAISSMSNDDDEDSEEEEEEEEDGDDIDESMLNIDVMISPDDISGNRITVTAIDHVGVINLPIYDNLNREISYDVSRFAENGYWEWLTMFAPSLMFTTKRPDLWMSLNHEDLVDAFDAMRFVIITATKDDDAEGVTYVVGIYRYGKIMMVNDNGDPVPVVDEEIYKKLNNIIMDQLPGSSVDYSKRAICDYDNIADESTALAIISEAINEDETIAKNDLEIFHQLKSYITEKVTEEEISEEAASDELVIEGDEAAVVEEEKKEEEGTGTTESNVFIPVRNPNLV